MTKVSFVIGVYLENLGSLSANFQQPQVTTDDDAFVRIGIYPDHLMIVSKFSVTEGTTDGEGFVRHRRLIAEGVTIAMKNKLLFKIVIYTMIAAMLLSTFMFTLNMFFI